MQYHILYGPSAVGDHFNLLTMAIIKYAPGVTPMRNEHSGYTFQSGRSANTMMKAQANDRERNQNQKNRQINLMRCTREWRTMTPAIRTAWINFATAYPQACKKNPLKFLTGYQLFLKRNHYLFLNEGITEPFMEAPLMQSLAITSLSFNIDQLDNCIDVTDAYIKSFGILPTAGDTLLFFCLPMALRSGQFFTPIRLNLTVSAVYIDGLFLSIILPADVPEIVFSIYLSLPINKSVTYTGTKTRYMGCFTTKTFLALTDTPSSYAGQAGKVATVNPSENALIFTTPGGGGITCADLVNCPTIISIINNINNIISTVLTCGSCSIPPVRYGTMYNGWSFDDVRNIAGAGWRVMKFYPTPSDVTTINTFLGGAAVSGGKLKLTGTSFWSAPNTGADNSAKFNLMPNGYVDNLGAIQQFGLKSSLGLSNSSPYFYQYSAAYDSTISTFYSIISRLYGYGCRLVKLSTSLTNGQTGSYTGNDGKVYRTICIGSLEITADNLNETKFADGSAIPLATTAAQWAAATNSMRCYPYFNEANK